MLVYSVVCWAGQYPLRFSGDFGFCSFVAAVLKNQFVSVEPQGEWVGDVLRRGRKWERHM